MRVVPEEPGRCKCRESKSFLLLFSKKGCLLPAVSQRHPARRAASKPASCARLTPPWCYVTKLLSHNPARYRDAALAGIRQMLDVGADAPIPAGTIDAVKMGTTVATNALLERRGARTLLLVNRGFADLLRIGHQARPDLFALDIVLPGLLYERVAEIAGRTATDGAVIEELDEAALRSILARSTPWPPAAARSCMPERAGSAAARTAPAPIRGRPATAAAVR